MIFSFEAGCYRTAPQVTPQRTKSLTLSIYSSSMAASCGLKWLIMAEIGSDWWVAQTFQSRKKTIKQNRSVDSAVRRSVVLFSLNKQSVQNRKRFKQVKASVVANVRDVCSEEVTQPEWMKKAV